MSIAEIVGDGSSVLTATVWRLLFFSLVMSAALIPVVRVSTLITPAAFE